MMIMMIMTTILLHCLITVYQQEWPDSQLANQLSYKYHTYNRLAQTQTVVQEMDW